VGSTIPPGWPMQSSLASTSANCPKATRPIRQFLLNGRQLVGKEVAQLWKFLDQVLQSMNGEARTINCQQPWLSAKLILQSGVVLEADSVRDWAVGMTWRGAAS